MKLFVTVCDVLMIMAHCLQERLYYVMEFMAGGNVLMLQTEEGFTEERAQFYAAEITLATVFLHKWALCIGRQLFIFSSATVIEMIVNRSAYCLYLMWKMMCLM